MALIRDLLVLPLLIILFGVVATCAGIGFGWMPEAIAVSEKRMALEILALGIASMSAAAMFGLLLLEFISNRTLSWIALALMLVFLVAGAILLAKSALL